MQGNHAPPTLLPYELKNEAAGVDIRMDPEQGTHMGWLADVLVALLGFAHALASWLYFSRERRWWLWSCGWVLATVSCLVAAQTQPVLGYGLFAAMVALWTIWWTHIRPSATRNWVPENRNQATATIHGGILTVHNVRNFNWTDKRSFTEAWEDRAYELAGLDGLDLFVCTWGDPRIAHIMVSFDFAGGPPLCFSIETRREVGERWTPLAGFMRSYELLMLAADERDVVKSRVNIRNEDVRLYRIYSTPEMRRRILDRYIAQINTLARRPRFYNTVFANCTIEVALLVHAAGHKFPLDWRLFVSGHVPEYLYDLELLDQSHPFAELKAMADVSSKSKAADGDPDYSRRIRAIAADPHAVENIAAPGVRPIAPAGG